MNRLVSAVSLLAAGVLLLTGCGGSGSSTAGDTGSPAPSTTTSTPLSQSEWMASGQPRETDTPPEPTSTISTPAGWGDTKDGNMLLHAGEYVLDTTDGASIRFQLPTPATDEAVAPIEAYRKKIGADPVTYLVADVDNRKGINRVNMYSVDVFDTDGKKVSFKRASDTISEWQRQLPDDSPSELSGVDIYNDNIEDAEAAERRTIVLATDATSLSKDLTRVAVSPSGIGNEQEATPAWAADQMTIPSYNCPRYQGPTCGVPITDGPTTSVD